MNSTVVKKRMRRGIPVILWMMMVGVASGGCIWGTEERQRVALGVSVSDHPFADSSAFKNTIGSMTYFEGLSPLRVRGYGLVMGLGKNGSRECPQKIREELTRNLFKNYEFSTGIVGEESIVPERLIDRLDTAVVAVQGEIPGGAVQGTSFDIRVSALPGTNTKSLRGGWLYTTELYVFHQTSSGTTIEGKLMAKAAGPVFLNPFISDDSATQANERVAEVVGGGYCVVPRDLHLVLTQPSYAMAGQIRDRINLRFPDSHRPADALSPAIVELAVPEAYGADVQHYLALVRSLYLSFDAGFEATRARELAKELTLPSSPHARIAECLEALGRAALPVLDELYSHPQDYVSFHAAVVGIRLGEHVAVDVMTTHAKKPNASFRFQAIRSLEEAVGMSNAAVTLRQLLNDEDPRVRVVAYEALLKRKDPSIQSLPIGAANFVLDLVPTNQSPFVYVWRTRRRRIALFGDELTCQPPVHYHAPDESLTINAFPEDDSLTIFRVVVSTGSRSQPIKASRTLSELIPLLGREPDVTADGEVRGLGIDYGSVVHALYQLSKQDCINARFILEEPNAAELFGPVQPAGRPESEL